MSCDNLRNNRQCILRVPCTRQQAQHTRLCWEVLIPKTLAAEAIIRKCGSVKTAQDKQTSLPASASRGGLDFEAACLACKSTRDICASGKALHLPFYSNLFTYDAQKLWLIVSAYGAESRWKKSLTGKAPNARNVFIFFLSLTLRAINIYIFAPTGVTSCFARLLLNCVNRKESPIVFIHWRD